MHLQETLNFAKETLGRRKINKAGSITLRIFRLYHEATVIKPKCTGTKTDAQISGTNSKSKSTNL